MKTILTIKDLKKAIELLADDDQVCLETVDKNGDTIDLFNFHIDVIDGIKLTDDRIVKEIRFCQENH